MNRQELSLDMEGEIKNFQINDQLSQVLSHPFMGSFLEEFEKLKLKYPSVAVSDLINIYSNSSNPLLSCNNKSSRLYNRINPRSCCYSPPMDFDEDDKILTNVVDPNAIFQNINTENYVKAEETMSFDNHKSPVNLQDSFTYEENIPISNYDENEQLKTINKSDIYNANVGGLSPATSTKKGRRKNKIRDTLGGFLHDHQYSSQVSEFASRDNSPCIDTQFSFKSSSNPSPYSQFPNEEHLQYRTPSRDSSPYGPYSQEGIQTQFSDSLFPQETDISLINNQYSPSPSRDGLTNCLSNSSNNQEAYSSTTELEYSNCSYLSPPYSNASPPTFQSTDQFIHSEMNVTTPNFVLPSLCPSDAKSTSNPSVRRLSNVKSSSIEDNKRAQRMSLVDFDDEEKHTRIREQNNRASRHYRERRKGEKTQIQNSISHEERERKQKSAELLGLKKQKELLLNIFDRMDLNTPIC